MTPEVAEKLQAYVARNGARLAGTSRGRPSPAEGLAAELAEDAEFVAVGLCSFWQDPTVEEVRDVLMSVPDPYGVGVPAELLATAMTLACSKRTFWPRIIAGAVATVVVGWIIARGGGDGGA